ncbi:LAMI_0D01794g1_1 [Lachancea mirantina]|uniref:LAMI_0D01794g1_1 n=1 Tax=Lachancea mirantina TaxID=1230905 RepID=A0A1G4J8T4_9SACH|nr:LAMI_0D01794g1_1 [Lachancea mirantina]
MTKSEPQLAEDIFQIAQEAYARFPASSKPGIRSNGVKEWTVLAAVVAIDTDNDTLRLVSAASGVKATPDEDLKRSQGRILHDCHAEILALRAFNAVVLRQIKFLANGCDTPEDIDLVEKIDESFRVRLRWKFALYISKLPCGDVSMSFDAGDEMKFEESDLLQYIKPTNRFILRGRFNHSKRGFVRTKPGRQDSSPTFSKSCTDKLCVRQVLSMLNSLTWSLLKQPVFLSYVVVPEPKDGFIDEVNKSFQTRLNMPEVTTSMKFIPCAANFQDDKLDEQQAPAATCSTMLNVLNGKGTLQESILNGMKNGFYVKKPKPLRNNCESCVSRSAQWELFREINRDNSHLSYLEFKSRQLGRNALKVKVQLALSPDGWIATREDDCHAAKSRDLLRGQSAIGTASRWLNN